MKASGFQQDIGGVDYLIRRIMNDTKCCGQLSPSDTCFTDIQFSGVKTAEESHIQGVDYCGPVKTSHKCFLLYTLEKSMKEWL